MLQVSYAVCDAYIMIYGNFDNMLHPMTHVKGTQFILKFEEEFFSFEQSIRHATIWASLTSFMEHTI